MLTKVGQQLGCIRAPWCQAPGGYWPLCDTECQPDSTWLVFLSLEWGAMRTHSENDCLWGMHQLMTAEARDLVGKPDSSWLILYPHLIAYWPYWACETTPDGWPCESVCSRRKEQESCCTLRTSRTCGGGGVFVSHGSPSWTLALFDCYETR